ncbi:MAG: prefoldin subunit beta [Candidatus Woesearchaeota archaeon]
MKPSQETQEKIARLSVMERNLEQLGAQKRQFQIQLVEIESALSELEKTSKAYKIIGNIMVASEKETLKNDLTGKKEMLDIRIRTLEKQENKLKEQASAFQEEIIKELESKQESEK